MQLLLYNIYPCLKTAEFTAGRVHPPILIRLDRDADAWPDRQAGGMDEQGDVCEIEVK